MTTRIGHDHPDVVTRAVTLERYAATDRPEIRLEEAPELEDGDVVRIVIEGTEYRARITARQDGTLVIRGVYETPRLARNPGDGTDYLPTWIETHDLSWGRTVHLDVVEPGFRYGLR
ncbi:MAG: hypothetical protein ABEI31_04400, partial [Halodesulfurarchaeum sp.]